jgi:transposase
MGTQALKLPETTSNHQPPISSQAGFTITPPPNSDHENSNTDQQLHNPANNGQDYSPSMIHVLMVWIWNLLQTIGRLTKDKQDLESKVQDLSEENSRLKEKVNQPQKNSANSSIPPSQGRYPTNNKTVLYAKINPEKGKPGAKKGHKAHHRKKPKVTEKNNSQDTAKSDEEGLESPVEEAPTEKIEIKPESTECPHCGTQMKRCPERDHHQEQYEMVPNPIIRKEYTFTAYYCQHCGKYHYPKKPPEALTGLFGPVLITLLLYTKGMGHVSITNLMNLLKVLGVKVSRGFICMTLDKGAAALEKAYNEIKKALPSQRVLNVDETGHKECGKKMWTWLFRAENFAFFAIKIDRAASVIFEFLGQSFKGIIGCDYFSAYRKYLKTLRPFVRAQFCLAHLKRDLTFLAEHIKDRELSAYGQKLLNILNELFGKNKLYRRLKAPRDPNDPDDLDLEGEARENKAKEVLGEMRQLGQQLKEAALDPPDRKKAKNIAKRFLDWPEDFYFTFMTDEGLSLGVGATNNAAEQSVRQVVIDRHVTQGTRSIKGRIRCERTWTVISSCGLQKRSAFTFIKESIMAKFCGVGEFPSLLQK